jgi:hypothetical protein
MEFAGRVWVHLDEEGMAAILFDHEIQVGEPQNSLALR